MTYEFRHHEISEPKAAGLPEAKSKAEIEGLTILSEDYRMKANRYSAERDEARADLERLREIIASHRRVIDQQESEWEASVSRNAKLKCERDEARARVEKLEGECMRAEDALVATRVAYHAKVERLEADNAKLRGQRDELFGEARR
jgi:chromosome segregation ATPase